MDKASVTRYVLLVIAVINAVLNLFGFQTISDDLANNIVAVISGIIMLWAGWKNNYLTKRGLAQKEVLKKEGLAK